MHDVYHEPSAQCRGKLWKASGGNPFLYGISVLLVGFAANEPMGFIYFGTGFAILFAICLLIVWAVSFVVSFVATYTRKALHAYLAWVEQGW